MRGRVMMILASAVLAGSLLATDAQARGGGGGGHGGGGGGHMGGFGGGHIGGFGGGRIEGFGGGHMAGMRGEHLGGGRRHFARGGVYDYGLACPYYPDIQLAVHLRLLNGEPVRKLRVAFAVPRASHLNWREKRLLTQAT